MSTITRQEIAARQTADTKILQKLNAAHREGFAEKFPGQTEHCLRLVMERLQVGLDKRGGIDLTQVDTWPMSPAELRELAEAAYYLNSIRKGL